MLYIKHYFLFIIILLCVQKSIAKTYIVTRWIRPTSLPLLEFQSQLQALGLTHISYAQSRLNIAREQAKSFKLKDHLITAQEFYLSGDIKKANQAFQNIHKFALAADWDQEDRRIILYAFLRQAQIEKNKEKKQALLLSAIEFSLFKINAKEYADYSLFPPPMQQQLQDLQKQKNILYVDWHKIFPQHQIILINGKRFKKNIKIQVPQGFYRISAFSSSHEFWTKNKNLSKIFTKTIRSQALTQGFCKNIKITSQFLNKYTKLMPVHCKAHPYVKPDNKPDTKLLTQYELHSLQTDLNITNSQNTIKLPSANMLVTTQKSKIFTRNAVYLLMGSVSLAIVLFLSFHKTKDTSSKDKYVY